MASKHNSNRQKSSKFDSWRWVALAALLVGVITLAAITAKTSAASATLSFSPSSGSYTVGNNVTVAVNENSGSDSVTSVQADFTYNQSSLQFVSIDGSSSGFGVAASASGSGGAVDISRGAFPGVTGSQLVANVTFKVLAAGSSGLNFDPVCQGNNSSSCIAVISVTNSIATNIATASSGATFTLSNPPASTPPASTPPASTPPASTPPATTTKSSGTTKSTTTSTSSKATSTTVTPTTTTSSTNSATVPNNGQSQLSQPADIQPATIQVDGVKEVDYYLNGKLVYTSKTPPYTYHINTKQLLNGTYNLQVKTLYTNGRTSTSNQKIHVANPFSLQQAWLFTRHYLLAPILIIVAIIAAWRAVVHLRRMGYLGGDSSGDGGGLGTTYSNQSEPPVVTPTTMYSQAQTVEVEADNGPDEVTPSTSI